MNKCINCIMKKGCKLKEAVETVTVSVKTSFGFDYSMQATLKGCDYYRFIREIKRCMDDAISLYNK